MEGVKNKMITPEEHNKKYFEESAKMKKKAKYTNIKCPECDEEMVYSDNMLLTTNPPQRNIHCPKCKYSTTIFC